MHMLNETHDVALRSWIESANAPETDFPIQNLPFAVFRRRGAEEPFRGGVAIGDQIVDLATLRAKKIFRGAAEAALRAAAADTLNPFMALGPSAWSALRFALSRALRRDAADEHVVAGCLVAQTEAEYTLPARIGDYTDFYTSVHHATNIGRQFRPDNPLLPNYKWVPIGYHGRVVEHRRVWAGICATTGQTMVPGESGPTSARAGNSTTNWNWASSSVPATRWASRSRSRSRRTRLRHLPAERLVGPRHPGLGVPAARAVPVEELRDHDLAMDRDVGSAWRRIACRLLVRRVIRSRCLIWNRQPTVRTARLTFGSRFSCNPNSCASKGSPRQG